MKTMFERAKPVWPKGMERSVNLAVEFVHEFSKQNHAQYRLRITASNVYKLFLNGEFAGYGPARAAHGHFRVDEWDFSNQVQDGKNIISVVVLSYNVENYYLIKQSPFLLAELLLDDSVSAYTDMENMMFSAVKLNCKRDDVPRYSIQRTFVEEYDLRPSAVNCLIAQTLLDEEILPLTEQAMPELLPRNVSYPEFNIVEPFENNDISQQGQVVDFRKNLTGFLSIEFECCEDSELDLVFDEILSNGDIIPDRQKCRNSVSLKAGKGVYKLETLEPYTLRYLKLLPKTGFCSVKRIYLREFVNPDTDQFEFTCEDNELELLFEAARETFRQNAPDIFMDCPSRERAGWLCDSFFMGRAEKLFTGENKIEKNFLSNYVDADEFPNLPAGMLPMCYPADHPTGSFIPQWPMWLVLELLDYSERSNDRDMILGFATKIFKLFEFYSSYENEHGLLENLPSWSFLEWSKASEFMADVNFPTNMLYAGSLEAAGTLYQKKDFIEKAEKIKKTIMGQAFDGTYFIDNAIREKGELSVTENRSEICQYFAFYFKLATPETHSYLWRRVVDDFSDNDPGDCKLHKANIFIGKLVRLEVLSSYRQNDAVLKSLKEYFLGMAEVTGTLWEMFESNVSCNHGFASYVANLIAKSVTP